VCGICGKIFYDGEQPVDQLLIKKMCSTLDFRGPDDEGVYAANSIGLGHRRLSIIDLGPTGRQPMSNEDGSVRLVFNGEIYNFPELRRDLETKGHIFTSKTDTEVIIHLYEEKGVACLDDLRGMFAFALWDAGHKRLFLARDRLGKKPLVYSCNNKGLVFASEIKALLCDPDITQEVDPVAVHHYLTYGYVPSPRTIFKSIQKLPPAHYLICENGTTRIERYWDLSFRQKLHCPSLEEYGERFVSILKDAVQCRLKSDVPFGAFLSGGIDSSIIVALMSGMLDRPVKTFSIGFDEQEYDELPYGRIIAKQYKTDHREFIVRPDVIDILPKIIWHYNEPYADSSAIPTFYLSQKTREYVTVALNGDGGDECFAGYSRHLSSHMSCYVQKLTALAGKAAVLKAVGRLPRGKHRHSFTRRVQRYTRALYEKPERRYLRWLCYFDNEMKNDLYDAAFKETVGGEDSAELIEQLYRRADAPAHIDKTLYVDSMSYLPEDLLVKVDIASMAHSLEARSPFVDHKVMEFAAALPPRLKLHGFTKKYLLKACLGKYLPNEIRHRKKMGFGVPIDRWLHRDLKDMVHDVLLDGTSQQRGYFAMGQVKNLLEEHVRGQYNHCYRIWNLLCLELWHRTYMDAKCASGFSASGEKEQ